MEEKARIVVYSSQAVTDIQAIYYYGADAFSPSTAALFVDELINSIDSLSSTYMHNAECRFLPTKSRMYRALLLLVPNHL